MNGKNRFLLIMALCLPGLCAYAGHGRGWRLTGDSLLVTQGSTYRYTVDTPENGGLVSTTPSVGEILSEIQAEKSGDFRIVDAAGKVCPLASSPVRGSRLQQLDGAGRIVGEHAVSLRHEALAPRLILGNDSMRVGVASDITLDFFAGQRSPAVTVELLFPPELPVTLDNVTVDVIGRGSVVLRNLSKQSIGRTGTNYPYKKVGDSELIPCGKEGTLVRLTGLDLRPDNGPDLRFVIKGLKVDRTGKYDIKASYTASEPEQLMSPVATATLHGVNSVADFARVPLRRGGFCAQPDFSWTVFTWSPVDTEAPVRVLCSTDKGKTWREWADKRLEAEDGEVLVSRLEPDKLYAFKLQVPDGKAKGESNIAWYYSGAFDSRKFGAKGDGQSDDTDALNKLISYTGELGGGVIRFSDGTYPVRTLHLKSNVWLLVDSPAVIKAIPGADAPETTWFSDRAYRSGLSPTDPRPYEDPENYMTKQDVGHTYFHNSMFFGERIENVKIAGTGRITGAGNIVTGDKVMNNAPEKRCDKMFTFKLCKDIEIGGIETGRDMWYDEELDLPYYIEGDKHVYEDSTMLHIDQGGHFVLLATGTDGIYVHDTWFGKDNTANARDIYDFMACNDVRVCNIYSRVSSDDIVKPGSDCSLGFTRPASNYMVRNIVGDTNCNLFQIGSETADDIKDLYIDNIYVLGANKAGFSISTNDGGHVANVYLNSGKTGPIHSRSVMKRTRAPFFISISNRGRVLGADVRRYSFMENGVGRNELLVTNSNIGRVENINIRGVDISEVYGGSSFRGERWKAFDGSQHEAAAIIAGFKLPDDSATEGGLDFRLPDGRHTGYVKDVTFSDINLTVKGGHPNGDADAVPPEIGVGRYNVGDLKIQPAYGFWFRHVDGVKMDNVTVRAEKADGRYPVYLDDVAHADIKVLEVIGNRNSREHVGTVRSSDISVSSAGASAPRLAWGPNHPIGDPKGIHPGRVVWSHRPGAATWTKGKGRWYEDAYNSQEATDAMVRDVLTSLTGEENEASAWDALFRYFNRTHGRGKHAYRKGEKIAVKLNLNNTSEYSDNEQLNASPHLTLSLLRSMVNEAGIPQECITLFDASRFMTDALFNKCHDEFPDVHYVDNEGTDGREKATYTADAIPYSTDNGRLARGLADCAIEADYLINVALLKGHGGQGVTLCAKNWYGATDINRNFRKNQHNNFNQDRGGKPRYMTFTDFMGHCRLGGKTMLFLIDGLYGSMDVNGAPSGKWKMSPFDNDWPCSLFASQDGVAIDAVGLDFLTSEFPSMPDVDYCDMYLVEAALANQPLSGTLYDPERDGIPLESLGVLEHWNNPREKLYSRNAGRSEGIELIYVGSDKQ